MKRETSTETPIEDDHATNPRHGDGGSAPTRVNGDGGVDKPARSTGSDRARAARDDRATRTVPTSAETGPAEATERSQHAVQIARCRRHELDPVRLSQTDEDRLKERIANGWRPALAGYYAAGDDGTVFIVIKGAVYLDALAEVDPDGTVTAEVWDPPDRETVLTHLGAAGERTRIDKNVFADLTAQFSKALAERGVDDVDASVASALGRTPDSVRNYKTYHALRAKFGDVVADKLTLNDMPAVRQMGSDAVETVDQLEQVRHHRAHKKGGETLARCLESLVRCDDAGRDRFLEAAAARVQCGQAPQEAGALLDGLAARLRPNPQDTGDDASGSGRTAVVTDPVRDLGPNWTVRRPQDLCQSIYQAYAWAAQQRGEKPRVKDFLQTVHATARDCGVVGDEKAYLTQSRFSELRHRDPDVNDRAHRLKAREAAILLIAVGTLRPLANHAVDQTVPPRQVKRLLDEIRALDGWPEAMDGYNALPGL